MIPIRTFANRKNFLQEIAYTREIEKTRYLIQKELILDDQITSIPGYCNFCRKATRFNFTRKNDVVPNFREELYCSHCKLNNRQRIILDYLTDKIISRDCNTFITEQKTILHKKFLELNEKVIGSEYLFEECELGESNNLGIRNEDLTKLSFDNGYFDLIVSLEVLEHIPDYLKAINELCRVLKCGGKLILTVPFITDASDNVVRAILSDNGSIKHLLSPEYHGDPNSKNECLCFYHFSWELLDDLRNCGFKEVKANFYWSLENGYLGNNQLFIEATK